MQCYNTDAMADILNQWFESLERTRKATFGKIATAFGATEISHETWDELEENLIQADLGVDTTLSVVKTAKKKVSDDGLTLSSELTSVLHAELLSRLDKPPILKLAEVKPTVFMLVGVNGSGKTTTAAKLAKWWQNLGKTSLLVAADTFRAAAIDQLEIWGERLGVPVISSTPDADPGAVTYDGIQSALSRGTDIVIIDTAGRLHTRFNLMEEIKKVHRVAGKALPGAPHFTMLVLDATTGQNALMQARAFKAAFKIDGIFLAKLDSSARGGMVFAIQQELGIPVLFAGLGEKPEDIQMFNPKAFVDGIFSLQK